MFYPDWNYDGLNTPWPGAHLGAESGGTWVWTNASSGSFNGRGIFESNCQHAGNNFHVVGDHVFFIHRAEYWQQIAGQQGNQIFHYRANGRFMGQFGTPKYFDGSLLSAPGGAANTEWSATAETNGWIYIFTNDEGSHGLHRWRVMR